MLGRVPLLSAITNVCGVNRAVGRHRAVGRLTLFIARLGGNYMSGGGEGEVLRGLGKGRRRDGRRVRCVLIMLSNCLRCRGPEVLTGLCVTCLRRQVN